MSTDVRIPAASTGDPVIDLAETFKLLFDDIIAARQEASKARHEAEEARHQAEDAAHQADAAGRRAADALRQAEEATRRVIAADRALEDVFHKVTCTLRPIQGRKR